MSTTETCTHLASCADCQVGAASTDPMGFVTAAQWRATHQADTLARLVQALSTCTGQSVAMIRLTHGLPPEDH